MTQSTYDEMFDRIELLESLLVEANTRIAELEGNLLMGLPKQFKPISEMTLEDWEQANKEHAVFVTSEGQVTVIEDVQGGHIFFNLYEYGFTPDCRHSSLPDKHYITARIH